MNENINIDILIPENINIDIFTNNIDIYKIKEPPRGFWHHSSLATIAFLTTSRS